jgi:hypothetical protein
MLEKRYCLSAGFYVHQVISQSASGPYNFASFGQGVSINDNDYVAFKAASLNTNNLLADNVYAYNPNTNIVNQLMNPVFMYPNAGAETLTPGTQSIFGEVQINNNNDVLARRRLNAQIQVGPPFGSVLTAPLTYLETWSADAPTPPGLPSALVANGVPAGASAALWFFLNPATGGVYPSPIQYGSVYEGLFSSSTINNSGHVNFSAIVSGAGNNRVSSDLNGSLVARGGISQAMEPMLADNDRYVLKFADGRIYVEGWVGGPLQQLAGTTFGFSAVSEAGISDDGSIITFAGAHTTSGPGIYASFYNAAANNYTTPVKILGVSANGVLDPGETHNDADFDGVVDVGEDVGGFSSFDLASRMPVNRTSANVSGNYTVAFVATRAGGASGLFTTVVDASNIASPKAAAPLKVVELGETIPGLAGAVTAIAIHDGVNNDAHVAYWVSTSAGREAVIESRDPVIQFIFDRDDNALTPPDHRDPTTDYVRIGLWDKAYDNNGNVLNAAYNSGTNESLDDRNNFIGEDSQRFHIRVTDPTINQQPGEQSTISHITVDWYTTNADGTPFVSREGIPGRPADAKITLTETSPTSGVFVSHALMLAANGVDYEFQINATSTAVATGINGGSALVGSKDYRMRIAGFDTNVVAEYRFQDPATGQMKTVDTKATVFNRKSTVFGGDERREIEFQVLNFFTWADDGYDKTGGTLDAGEGDNVFTFTDTNSNGFWDPGESRETIISVSTPQSTIDNQLASANDIWLQAGVRFLPTTAAYVPLPIEYIKATGLFMPSAAQPMISLMTSPLFPDNRLYVSFLPFASSAGKTTISEVEFPGLGDRFVVFVRSDIESFGGSSLTLGHELYHALYNREDENNPLNFYRDVPRQFSTFNATSEVLYLNADVTALPDVRVHRRMHSATLNWTNDDLNYVRLQRTGRFPVPGVDNTSGNNPFVDLELPTATTGNKFAQAVNTLSIADGSVTEAGPGTTPTMNFQVTLSRASTQTITVTFATQDGTATAGNSDFVITAGTVTFNPGEQAKTISVLVQGDNQLEPNENFSVRLISTSANVAIADNEGVGTIINDDTAIPVAVSHALNLGRVSRSTVSPISIAFDQSMNITSLATSGDIVNAIRVVSLASGTPVSLAVNRYSYNQTTNTVYVDTSIDGFGGSPQSVLGDGYYEVRLDTTTIRSVNGNFALQDTDGLVDGMYRFQFHKLQGDANGDTIVNRDDYLAWRAAYGTPDADLNGDGVANSADYTLWRNNLGAALGPMATASVEIEVATAAASSIVPQEDHSQFRLFNEEQNQRPASFAADMFYARLGTPQIFEHATNDRRRLASFPRFEGAQKAKAPATRTATFRTDADRLCDASQQGLAGSRPTATAVDSAFAEKEISRSERRINDIRFARATLKALP